MVRLFRPIILLSFFCLPLFSLAQEVPAIAKEIENVIEKNDPKWKIERPYVQMTPVVMHLKSSQGDVLIYFWLMDSERNAKEVFDGNVIALRNILGKRKKESNLPDFADDNCLLSDDKGGFAHLNFRSNTIYISIAAPSEILAKKFARYVLNEISAERAFIKTS